MWLQLFCTCWSAGAGGDGVGGAVVGTLGYLGEQQLLLSHPAMFTTAAAPTSCP